MTFFLCVCEGVGWGAGADASLGADVLRVLKCLVAAMGVMCAASLRVTLDGLEQGRCLLEGPTSGGFKAPRHVITGLYNF